MAEENKEFSGKIYDSTVLKRLFSFVDPYKGMFAFVVFLTLMIGVVTPLRPLLIQYTIDEYITNRDINGLQFMAWLMVGLLIVQFIINYAHAFFSGWLGQSVIRDIRIKLYDHIIRLRQKFFDNTQIGRLVTRNISDIETLADVFSQGLAALAGDILQIVSIFIIMVYMDWQLTLVTMSMVPFLIISTYVFKEKIKSSFNDVRTAVSNLNSFVQEHITGMNIVQIFSAEKREYEKFKKINAEHRDANLRSVLYYSIYFPVAEILIAVGTGLVVWYGAGGVLREDITFGTLIGFIMYVNMFFRPMRTIADRFNTLQMGIVSTSRIIKLLDNTEHIPDDGNYIPQNIRGDISLEKVWFAYNDEEWVLKNINLEIKQGQAIALVGATGAGKTSIINLLSRFYDIQKGIIKVDNINIKDYKLHELRKEIGVVLQDVFLFSDTIENNITLGDPDITREQVWEAAQLVGADKFISQLPGKLDYNVMERGNTLSVGQRQLLSFIRAIVYNPSIIVLDEATSSVDTETEEIIQEAIEKMMKGRTAIAIAHRLSTIQKADKIVVLDKGEIKEQGNHEELLARNGFYANLYQMQFVDAMA